MFYVATCLLFDKNGKLLIYLRDNKPDIPFPNHWDLFGGMIEEGETPGQALVREVEEELGITLGSYKKFRDYDCQTGDISPNKKYVFYAKVNAIPEELKLLDVGQRLTSISLEDRYNYDFANILGGIIDDFATSGIEIE